MYSVQNVVKVSVQGFPPVFDMLLICYVFINRRSFILVLLLLSIHFWNACMWTRNSFCSRTICGNGIMTMCIYCKMRRRNSMYINTQNIANYCATSCQTLCDFLSDVCTRGLPTTDATLKCSARLVLLISVNLQFTFWIPTCLTTVKMFPNNNHWFPVLINFARLLPLS